MGTPSRTAVPALTIRSLALCSAITKPLVKAIHAPAGIDYLLLARIKGVAMRAHINVEIFATGGACLYGIATTAGRSDGFVLGMDIRFH